jgi:TolB-like protein
MTDVISFGPFIFDPAAMTVSRDGKAVALGSRGAALLGALAGTDGPVGKDALLEAAWPGTVIEEANLSVQVAALRKALGTREDGQDWILTVPRVGYRLLRPAPSDAAPSGGGRPAIAVMPFANLSADPEQAFFADGVVEDLITALSRFKLFGVVARNSSFAYKDRAIDVREVARELGVRYVLEGGVRRAGEHVRVTAQLVDAESGMHIWADRFDGEATAIFDFQDSITESVIGLIEPRIRKAEIERSRRKRPESLDAHELFLRAGPMVLGTDTAAYSEAIELLNRAIALDPGYAPAYALAGWAHEKRHTFIPEDIGKYDDANTAIAMSEKALELDRDDAGVLALAAWNIMLFRKDHERGLRLVSEAIELNPNYVLALNFASLCFVTAGQFRKSEECNLRALRLSPGAPDAYWSYTNLANIAFYEDRFEEAIDWAQKALAVHDGWIVTWSTLVAANCELGRMDEARNAIARIEAIHGTFSPDLIDPGEVSPPAYRDKFINSVRKVWLR